ncbi:MAG: zinc-dependent metalloprotease, partial [Planctomycetota bacterium]
LQYATDEDAWGPDPLVNRFDLGAEPLEWAETRLQLVWALREELLDRAVEDGQSWHLLRQAYEQLLGEQVGALRVAGRYLGGVYVHRDHKGDPAARDPLVPVEADKQRQALAFLIDNAFSDQAFDLRPEVLHGQAPALGPLRLPGRGVLGARPGGPDPGLRPAVRDESRHAEPGLRQRTAHPG